MRAKITFLLFPLFGLSFLLSAQVKTNLNNDQLISTKGHFNKGYKEQIDFEISAKNVKELVEKEKKQFRDEKLFRFAEPVSIDLDIANHILPVSTNMSCWDRLKALRMLCFSALPVLF